MTRPSSVSTVQPAAAALADPRHLTAGLAMAVGAATSGALSLAGVEPGAVLVPLSLAALVVLLLARFPVADYLLAFSLVATFPLLPPLGVPNVPLALGVLVVALSRLTVVQRSTPARASMVLLGSLWATLALGVAVSHFPPVAVWLRPTVLLIVAAVASAVGLLVWRDPGRRRRWLIGIVAGSIVVSLSALVVFAMQYTSPAVDVAAGLAELLGYVRGSSAAEKFAAQTNWIIWGEPRHTLRAVSPLFPAPNNLGGYLGIVTPLAAFLWLVASDRRVRALAACAVLLGIVALMLTVSRSSWLAAVVASAVALLALLLITRLSKGTIRLPNVTSIAHHLALVALAALVGLGGLITTLNTPSVGRITDPSLDPSVIERVETDSAALERIRADPFRGAGLGNWTGLTDSQLAERDPNRQEYVHNVYLEYAGAAGIFGLVWSVAVVLLLLLTGFLAARRGGPPRSWLLGVSLCAVAVFAAVQFMFDDNLLNPQYAWLLLWAVGGGVALFAEKHATDETGLMDQGAPAG